MAKRWWQIWTVLSINKTTTYLELDIGTNNNVHLFRLFSIPARTSLISTSQPAESMLVIWDEQGYERRKMNPSFQSLNWKTFKYLLLWTTTWSDLCTQCNEFGHAFFICTAYSQYNHQSSTATSLRRLLRKHEHIYLCKTRKSVQLNFPSHHVTYFISIIKNS